MSEKLYKFSYEGRNTIESTFTATPEEIDWIVGQDIWFGDIWGKHSSVQLTMEAENFIVTSEDPAFISQFKETVGTTGECPFDYLDEAQWEEYDEKFTTEEA